MDKPGYINGVPVVWEMSRSALLVERDRLENGVRDGDDGIGTLVQTERFFCDGRSHEVLERARAVMKIVNAHGLAEHWPSDDQWPDLLPEWFVSASETNVPEGRLHVPKGERLTSKEFISETWSVPAWTFWLDPARREWLWFLPVIESADAIRFSVDQVGDPPAGVPLDLVWLFRASGAVDCEEDDWQP